MPALSGNPSPSAVLSSSRGSNELSRSASGTVTSRADKRQSMPVGVLGGGGGGGMKAIETTRRNLVAYEYLCHVAECVDLPYLPISASIVRLC